MIVYLLNTIWLLTSVFMILLILIQRGKGGGLAGAFGGVGGSSAFGTKAGDVFTRITVVTFVLWLVLGMVLVGLMTRRSAYTPGSQAVSEPETGATPGAPPKASEGMGEPGGPAPPPPTPVAGESSESSAKDAESKPATGKASEPSPAPAKPAATESKPAAEEKPKAETPAKPGEKSK